MPLHLGPGEPTIVHGPRVPAAPRVSVVIPSYTHTWLDECLDSVRAQTVGPVEIILVDDGSPEPAAPAVADDLVLIRQENTRPGGARNRGVGEARGEWVAFLDSDDRWRPEKLARQLAFHDQHPACLLSTTDSCPFDDDGRLGGSELARYRLAPGLHPFGTLLYENFIITSASLVQRQAYLASGGMALGRWCEEPDAWLRVARGGQVGLIGEILVERRHHAQSWTQVSDRAGRLFDDEWLCLEQFFADYPEERRQPYVPAALARFHRDRGYNRLERGEYAAARADYATAIRHDPAKLAAWKGWWRAVVGR